MKVPNYPTPASLWEKHSNYHLTGGITDDELVSLIDFYREFQDMIIQAGTPFELAETEIVRRLVSLQGVANARNVKY